LWHEPIPLAKSTATAAYVKRVEKVRARCENKPYVVMPYKVELLCNQETHHCGLRYPPGEEELEQEMEKRNDVPSPDHDHDLDPGFERRLRKEIERNYRSEGADPNVYKFE
jgi:hypothetical protein